MKSIITAGFIPIILETTLKGDSVATGDIEAILSRTPHHEILCIFTTTSCFAPRIPDDIEKIAGICKDLDIPHVINNAYGLQCSKITHKIKEAARIGRVDAVVQSTDKNFLVPVGGAIIASQDKALIKVINELYPGRASISPVLDLFITFLAMGQSGYRKLLSDRKELLSLFRTNLQETVEKYGEKLLHTPENSISFAITCRDKELGSKLFLRRVSGSRYISGAEKEVCGFLFKSYGSSFSGYSTPYITAACAVGLSREEINLFIQRLTTQLDLFHRQETPK